MRAAKRPFKAARFTALLACAIGVAAAAPAAVIAQEHAPSTTHTSAEETDPERPDRSEPARARRPVSMTLLLGYGALLEGSRPSLGRGGNGFGVGFGAAAGYDLSLFYFGARFLFFLGGAAEVGEVVVSRKETTIGLEAGIAFTLARLTLRPQIGVGLAIESAERERGDIEGRAITADDSSEVPYVAPGIAVLYDLDDSLFIGVDAQVPLIISEGTLIGLAVLGSAGMRF